MTRGLDSIRLRFEPVPLTFPPGVARARRALIRFGHDDRGRGLKDIMAWLAIAIFAVTIVVVIWNVVDSTVAALIGVSVMIWIGVMTDVDAFGRVDWNVMAILVSVWTIAA